MNHCFLSTMTYPKVYLTFRASYEIAFDLIFVSHRKPKSYTTIYVRYTLYNQQSFVRAEDKKRMAQHHKH